MELTVTVFNFLTCTSPDRINYYLYNCDVEEGTTEADGNGSGGHDGRTGEESDGHGKCCN